MSDSMMDKVGGTTHERHHKARLGLVTNTVLFEALRPFHRSPERLKRVGRSGLFLFSVASIEINQKARSISEYGEQLDHPVMAMPEANRLATDLNRLSSGDTHMRMTEHLRFAKSPDGGILIEMGVLLTPMVKARLSPTSFIQEDASSMLVSLSIDNHSHAGGVAMQHAARALDATLKSQYPPAGTEAIDLIIT
jgi:hypothetical protein